MVIRVVTALLLLLASQWAQAALNAAQIEQFITATEAVMRYGEEHLKDLPEGEDSIDFAHWSQSMVKLVEDSGHSDAISKLVKEAGYSSLQQWADTSESVMLAMFASLMNEQLPMMQGGLAMLEAMANNPQLKADDKAQLQQQLAEAKKAISRAQSVPAADVAAVKPYLPRLQQLFDGAVAQVSEAPAPAP